MVGISSFEQDGRFGAWELPAALVPHAYVQSVERAGGRPLLIPPLEDTIEETLDILDALVLSGGADLDPETYGAAPHAETRGTQPERDRAELALLRAALRRAIPVLAICRGMQLLNVSYGGTLNQHLPDLVGHTGHRETHGIFSSHDVRLKPGSTLATLLGEHAQVQSSHHQGLDRLGCGVEAVGWAADGSIEAIEDPAARFAVGVLWHPEVGDDTSLFEALVSEGRAYRTTRSRL